MIHLKALAALAMGVAAMGSQAQAIGVHLGSYHGGAAGMNNINPGVYYKADSGFTAGAYYNSHRRPSAYMGYTHEWGALAVTVGAITGYNRTALPMVVPSLRIVEFHQVTARLAFVPKVRRDGASAVHLMVEFPLR